MGRKSLKKERTDQILDAFEQCITKYGLTASSLPKVANKAGVQLSVIHHYIGNRNDLVKAMLERFVGRYTENLRVFGKQKQITSEIFIKFLFGPFSEKSEDDIIFDELFAASSRNANINGLLYELYGNFTNIFSEIIGETYPTATKKKCHDTAAVIISLWFGHLSMLSINLKTTSLSTSAKNTANLLLNTLK